MDILERIFAQKRIDLALNKIANPLEEIKAKARDQSPTRGFSQAIENSSHSVALIAEVKKASPIKGVLRENFDPVEIAHTYEKSGADCLSILTDVEFFQGHPDYLSQCRAITSLPVLRKDFTVDEYDIWFARSIGADAVLLIADYLSESQLREYREISESLGMDALIEVHDENVALCALASGANLIGVNNRNLKDFKIDISATTRIAPLLKGKATIVSESAISKKSDIDKVAQCGARAVLIGTAFCSAQNIGDKVKEVMNW